MNAGVRVTAPCRLHFGMFSFGDVEKPQFGGVGAMVNPPTVEVTFSPAQELRIEGALAERAKRVIELLVSRWEASQPACEVVVRAPASHTGLGVGTQLGLAIAAGLRRFLGLTELPIAELAAQVGRGARSAVGTYGFQHGGLIVDAGKLAGQALGTLQARLAIPEDWRFVLFSARHGQGLAGASEASAFERLPAVPREVTRDLWQITNEELLPAVADGDCPRFGEAVYQFGRLAGECFSAVQGRPFANAETAQLIETIRSFGVAGAGQSSWGPTVYAITDGDDDSHCLINRVHGELGATFDVSVARPNNRGANVEVVPTHY